MPCAPSPGHRRVPSCPVPTEDDPGPPRRPMTQLDARPPTDPEQSPSKPAAGSRTGSGGWFRAVWRWHFFASIVIVPVLLVLATTGLIYLFRFQLEPLLHPDLLKVDQPAGMDFQQPYGAQLDAAQRAYPDATLTSVAEPRSAERPTVINAEMPDGTVREIYVNPWGADVLGSMNPDTTLSGYAVRLHADLMSGVWGDRLLEARGLLGAGQRAHGLLPVLARATSPCPQAEVPAVLARPHRRGRRHRPAHPPRLRPPVDRLLGSPGPGARHPAGHLPVEPRPRRRVGPRIHPRRVPAPQPRRALGRRQDRGARAPTRRDTTARSPTSTPRSTSPPEKASGTP